MSHSKTEILVGGGVLAAALAFGFYALSSTDLEFGGDSYDLRASFRSAEGVTVGTDVRLAGVKIGTVSGLELNPETYRADTVVTIRDGIQIPDDSAILVSSEGLLGGTFVEVSPGGSLFYYESGDEILDTQSSVSLVSLLLKFVSGEGE